MCLAIEREAIAAEQILDIDGAVVGQSPFPERDLVGAFLPTGRIEVDQNEDAVRLVRAHLRVGDDVVVRGVQRDDVAEVVQGRIVAADRVQLPDVILDVAGPVVVPDLDLVLLGILVFLAPGQGRASQSSKPE